MQSLNDSRYTYMVPFGSLPIGTTFERTVRVKDPADRRRRIFERWPYVKKSQGTIAGFATSTCGTWRADNNWPVYIDATNLKLIVECLRSVHASHSLP